MNRQPGKRDPDDVVTTVGEPGHVLRLAARGDEHTQRPACAPPWGRFEPADVPLEERVDPSLVKPELPCTRALVPQLVIHD